MKYIKGKMKISKPKLIIAGHLESKLIPEEPSIELCEYNSVCKMPRENYCYKVRSENCRPYKFYSKYPEWVYDRNDGGMFV